MKNFKHVGVFLFSLFVFFSFAYADENSRTLNKNFIGKINNWDVEVWTQETIRSGARDVPISNMGGVEMIVFGDGTFSAAWNKTFNSLFRTGRKFPRGTKLSDVGEISLAYDVSVFKSDNTSYLCVYGWTRGPLIEWYIVDNWHPNYRPGGQVGRARGGYEHHGTLETDDGIYDIYTGWRENQPSIDGTRTFLQVFSVRQTTRTSGKINVSAHFERWAKIGEVTRSSLRSNFADANELYEVSFTIEGFGGENLSTGESKINFLCIRYGKNNLCTKKGCENCGAGEAVSASPSPSPSVSPSPSQIPSPNVSPSPSQIPSPNVSPSPSQTPSPTTSSSPQQSPSPQQNPSPSVSPSPQQTPSPNISPSPQQNSSPSVSPSPQQNSSPSVSPSPQQSPSPSVSPSPSQTPSPNISPSPQQSPSPAPVPIMRFAIGETQFTSRNTAQTLEAAPFIESGRTMVPLRAIAEGLDAAAILGWNDGVVYISRGGADFTLAVGVALPDGMGTPVVVAGRVFVPARYVSEIFGATIRWENSTREVFIYEE